MAKQFSALPRQVMDAQESPLRRMPSVAILRRQWDAPEKRRRRVDAVSSPFAGRVVCEINIRDGTRRIVTINAAIYIFRNNHIISIIPYII